MSELSKAEIYRNIALSKKDERRSTVKSTTLLATVVEFLNSDRTEETNVEALFEAKKPKSQVLARFKNVIIENNLSDLVFPINSENEDGIVLVKLVAPVEDANDDENDDDTLSLGVEVVA